MNGSYWWDLIDLLPLTACRIIVLQLGIKSKSRPLAVKVLVGTSGPRRRRNWQPTPVFLLENPVDRGAWWAAVRAVAQSWIQLKRLSMHACIGVGIGNPLQYSCLENHRERGAWWAAVCGVAQSRTRLKRLSSSSSSMACRILPDHELNLGNCQSKCGALTIGQPGNSLFKKKVGVLNLNFLLGPFSSLIWLHYTVLISSWYQIIFLLLLCYYYVCLLDK